MKLFKGLQPAILALSLIIVFCPSSLKGCDDTLVMLLTSQNPASEFSKAIRSFTTALTNLGSVLKVPAKDNFDNELNQVMEAWLAFSTRYMTNPPEEARNDRLWQQKTADTARFIGEIRKLVHNSQFSEAHDKILDLSGRIGMFFESFGVSDEKQLFIKTSTNLTNFERLILIPDYEAAIRLIPQVRSNLEEFKKLLSASLTADCATAEHLIGKIEADLAARVRPTDIDATFQELKNSFEALRSQILMHEWFPALNPNNQEK
ncbi:MAG: hypothetical protein PHD82_14560 [Candidatus Riflebacteria bacterium]|jgi:hypothetical protein|nr:hypothetical protein [Candidatus Riflebacteria bacterium]